MTGLEDPDHWLASEAQLKIIRDGFEDFNAGLTAQIMTTRLRMALAASAIAMTASIGFAWSLAVDDVQPVFLSCFAILALGAFFWNWVFSKAISHERQLRRRVFPAMFGFISNFHYEIGTKPSFLDKLKQTEVLHWDKFETEDCFKGNHEGLIFELCEIDLFSDDGENSKTNRFQGLILHLKRTSQFGGVLLARQKRDMVERIFGYLESSSHQAVSSGIPEIDLAYDFRTSNAGADYAPLCIMSGKVLAWLKEIWNESPVQIAFDGDDCFLLIQSGANNFELPYIQSGDLRIDRDVLPLVKTMMTLLKIAHLISKIGAEKEQPVSLGQA